MARRAKSYEEIMEQRNRILGRLGLGADADSPSASSQGYRQDANRAEFVINTASRYLNNIRGMRSFVNNSKDYYANGGSQNPETVRYARSTYMGNANK